MSELMVGVIFVIVFIGLVVDCFVIFWWEFFNVWLCILEVCLG